MVNRPTGMGFAGSEFGIEEYIRKCREDPNHWLAYGLDRRFEYLLKEKRGKLSRASTSDLPIFYQDELDTYQRNRDGFLRYNPRGHSNLHSEGRSNLEINFWSSMEKRLNEYADIIEQYEKKLKETENYTSHEHQKNVDNLDDRLIREKREVESEIYTSSNISPREEKRMAFTLVSSFLASLPIAGLLSYLLPFEEHFESHSHFMSSGASADAAQGVEFICMYVISFLAASYTTGKIAERIWEE